MTIFEKVPLHVEGKESKIGLVVIQEWWGLNNQIKKATARFAEAVGALAVCPDLYRGKVAAVPDEARHLFGGLDWPNAVNDIAAASRYLKSRGCQKVGVVGFCMGGALAIAACVLRPEHFDSGVCFYGIPPSSLCDPSKLQVPMQFHFGDKDHSAGFSDKKAADALKLKLTGKTIDFNQYPDGDHAFMNEEAPAYPYNQPVATLAFGKTVDWFTRTLSS